MSQKVMADLAIKIDANSAELKRELNKTNQHFKKFGSQQKRMGKDIRNSWLKLTAAVAAAGGAIKTAEKIMMSTQGTGDQLTMKIEGLKGGFERLFEKVAEGDFSNLINDFNKARTAAENFTVAMDELGDVNRALSVQKAENLLRIEELKLEVEKFKYSNPEKAREAAQEIIRISEEEISKAVDVSEFQLKSIRNRLIETYDISLRDWDLLLDYISNYDKLTESIYSSDLLSETDFEKAQKLEQVFKDLQDAKKNQVTMENVVAGFGEVEDIELSRKEINRLTEEYNELLANSSKEVKQWATVLPLVNKLTDEERQNIADVIIEMFGLQREMVRRQKQGETYLSQLDRQIEKEKEEVEVKKDLVQTQKEYNDVVANSMMGFKGAEIGGLNIKMSGGDNVSGFDWIAAQMSNATDKAYLLTDAISGIGDAIQGMIAGNKSSWKDFVMSMLAGGRDIINMLLAKALAGLFSDGATKGPVGLLVAGAIGVPMLMGLWSQVPEFANGGLVYGDTIARVGEYPNARANPEVIAPLNKLKTIMGDTGGGIAELRLKGYDLVAAVQKNQSKYNMT